MIHICTKLSSGILAAYRITGNGRKRRCKLLKILAKALVSRRRGGCLKWLAIPLLLATTACVTSTGPILSDPKAILGDGGQLHLYDVGAGATRNHRSYRFQWNGRSYVVQGRASEVSEFTVHAYEGRDLIVQARTRRPLRPYSFALARKLADGVYILTAIDPGDSDDAARNRFCVKTRDAPCRIETPEQLFVFARASAAREAEGGKLAVLVRAKGR